MITDTFTIGVTPKYQQFIKTHSNQFKKDQVIDLEQFLSYFGISLDDYIAEQKYQQSYLQDIRTGNFSVGTSF